MPNMSYCRFQNTLGDLQDCADNMVNTKDASGEEIEARKGLIDLCVNIALDFGSEVDRPCEESE